LDYVQTENKTVITYPVMLCENEASIL